MKPGTNTANIKIRFLWSPSGDECEVQSFQRSCMAEVKYWIYLFGEDCLNSQILSSEKGEGKLGESDMSK